jgi:hypothetical protein
MSCFWPFCLCWIRRMPSWETGQALQGLHRDALCVRKITRTRVLSIRNCGFTRSVEWMARALGNANERGPHHTCPILMCWPWYNVSWSSKCLALCRSFRSKHHRSSDMTYSWINHMSVRFALRFSLSVSSQLL